MHRSDTALDMGHRTDTAESPASDCRTCPVRHCLGREPEAAAWAASLTTRNPVMPGGRPLFVAAAPLCALYSVRAGCIKTSTVDADGREHVRGFHLPGDLLGLDALHAGRFQANAVAVVPSQVCAVPVAALRRALDARPRLAQRIAAQISRELALALALGGDHGAENRLAAFLLSMEQRLGAPRNAALRLPMPQRDIGSHLRLANETVCRTLRQFIRRGWLRRDGRTLIVLARQRLQVLAEPVGLPVSAPAAPG